MSRMRAKFQVVKIDKFATNINIQFRAVGANSYGPNGENEDNDFARYTPMGELSMSINNSNLFDVFNEGDKVYLDFTKCE